VTPADYNQFLLAIAMWREARGEGVTGMTAVGHVIANRAFRWNKTLHDVIVGINQFSSMTVKGDPETVLWPPLNDSVFGLAETVYSGLSKDPTMGALYYANENIPLDGWYQRDVIESGLHPITVVIGKHTFRK